MSNLSLNKLNKSPKYKYGWKMSQKPPVNGFEWINDLSQFQEKFIKNYDEDSNKEYFLENNFFQILKYLKSLHNLHSDLPFLREERKCNKLVCDFYDKKNYVVYIKASKQALNHGLILKKVHRVTQFNKKTWLKPYIYVNTELRKEAKNDFEKDFFNLNYNAVFSNNNGKCE